MATRKVTDIRRAISGVRGPSRNPELEDSPSESPRPRKIDPAPSRDLLVDTTAVRAVPTRGRFRLRWIRVLGYVFIVVTAALIAAIGYGTYTFSKYQGVILPGVYVDSVPLGDQSQTQALDTLFGRLHAMPRPGVPIEFAFRGHVWKPNQKQLRLHPDLTSTISQAYSIGRSGNFWRELFDRLPLRRRFDVTLVSPFGRPQEIAANFWVAHTLVPVIHQAMANAKLAVDGSTVKVLPSRTGYHVNVSQAVDEIRASRGSLSTVRTQVPVVYTPPAISDQTAATQADRINAFLAAPPTLRLRHYSTRLDPHKLASFLRFSDAVVKGVPIINEGIDWRGLRSYIKGITAAYSARHRPANPQISFDAGVVTVVSPGHNGRVAGGSAAFNAVLQDLRALTPRAVVQVPVRKVKPAINVNNPTDLGITTLLGEGESSLTGSPPVRIADLECIIQQLNTAAGPTGSKGILANETVSPGTQISLDSETARGLGGSSCSGAASGAGWNARVYRDRDRKVAGRFLPTKGGAMQQLATTFFRALYAAGLPVLERHAHPYRLGWYEPPVGMDAIVSPNGKDLRFQNNTGGYVLIQVRVVPVQHELYVYVYGRKTGWQVTVGSSKVLKVTPPGPPVTISDDRLPSGTRRYEQYPHAGEQVQVTRIVTIPGVNRHRATTRTDTLLTNYQPWPAIILVGPNTATPTPIPTPLPPSPTPTPLPSPSPSPSPVPTLPR